MDKPLIDHHQAIQGLRQAVAERGRDYIDPRTQGVDSRYVVDGEPSCIGGTALFKLGVPVTELAKWEGFTCDAMVSDADTASPIGQGFLTRKAASVLTEAQNTQDRGRTWSKALVDAEDMYRVCTELEEQR